MARLRDMLIDLAVMAFIALMLALLGPFGMFTLPLGIRLLYWLIVGIGGYLLYHPVMIYASRLGPRLELPTAGLWSAACLLMSVPMTALIWIANGLIGRPDAFVLTEAIALYGNIVLVAGLVCLIFWFASAKRRAELATQPAPALVEATPLPASIAFLDRLSPQIGTDLIALEMEDHYVRAHTAHGSALILLRLRDAIAELGPLDGAQVHRSWWVARGAVEQVVRDGRNIRLQLRGGLFAPVSRSATAELKAKGWLQDRRVADGYDHRLPEDAVIPDDLADRRGRLTEIVIREILTVLPPVVADSAPRLAISLIATVHGHCTFALNGSFALLGENAPQALAVARVRESIAAAST